MKKNISINISGIIFHIEEDGYETLKKYLDSINKYFASFDDSTEILADIESRIAEIFLSKLNEGKQVITFDDVNALIATMGSVSDFKAAEELEAESTNTSSEREKSSHEKKYTYVPPRQFLRDQKRKIMGGVCAGLARYANVDPVWIRLLFALFTAVYGITIIIYIVLWIVIPGSYDLDEPSTKKMFRDSENKALGGVSGGVAAYFGIDIVAVRVLFIAFTIAGGLGLIAYVVLWVILPEAKTITDRMKMQGEPVTLSNIESNIKKELNENEGEESVIVKILLFPFRMIALVVTGLAKILGPMLEVVRVFAGILIMLFAIGLIFTSLIGFGALVGLFAFPWSGTVGHGMMGFPIDSIQNMIPTWMGIAAFFAALIPSVFILLLGLTIINNRGVINASIGWVMFIVLLVSIGSLAVGIPRIAFNFKQEGEFKQEQTFTFNGKTTPFFKINEVGLDEYDGANLTIKGYHDNDIKLVQYYQAQGTTRQEAIENARMVDYYVNQNDSIITFDSNITFRENTKFRAQRLNMTLYVPYNRPFVMDKGFSRFISQYIKHQYLDGYTWSFTEKGLECVNCNDPEEQRAEEINESIEEINDFDEIDISGKFDVSIRHGDHYSIEFTGPTEERNKYNVYRSGRTLVIDYEGKKNFNFNMKEFNVEEVRITLTVPELQRIKATGYGSLRFDDMLHMVDDMEIEAAGPIKLRGDVSARHLVINLTGSAEAELIGKVETLNADVTFASKLKAYHLEAQDAVVEVNGASSAKVNVSRNLEIEEGIASDVDYRGNPTVIKND